MSELTYPGVYLEEKSGVGSPVNGVTTSTGAFVGFAERGPVDEPKLITGIQAYEQMFGRGDDDDMYRSMLGFFANDGKRALVVRVVGGGAAKSVADFGETVAEDTGEDGDGTVGPYSLSLSKTPLTPGSVSIATGGSAAAAAGTLTAVAKANLIEAETFTLDDGVNTPTVFEFDGVGGAADGAAGTNVVVDVSGATTAAQVAAAIVAAINGVGATLAITAGAPTGAVIPLTNGAQGSFGNEVITDTVVDAGFTHTGMTGGVSVMTVTDDGVGGLEGDGSGTVDYETGDIVVTFDNSVVSAQSLVVTNRYVTFSFELAWPGVAGDTYELRLQGVPNRESDATATFERWQLTIWEVIDVVDGTDVFGPSPVETFTDLVLDTPAHARFLTTVVNEPILGSKIVVATAEGNDEAPSGLSGILQTNEVPTTAPAHDGAEKAFVYTFDYAVHRSTMAFQILNAASAVRATLTDDGVGGLVQDDGDALQMDSGVAAVIDYDAKTITVVWATAPAGTDTARGTYYSQAEDTVATARMADGSDGAALTTLNVTAPSLESTKSGIFALLKSTEIGALVLPGFESNPTAIRQAVDFGERFRTWFLIFSAPAGMSFQEAADWRRFTLRVQSSFCAGYYPDLVILDPLRAARMNFPPCAHIAGIYARTDTKRGVWKAPAGVEDGKLAFTEGLVVDLGAVEVGTITQAGLNAMVSWDFTGLCVWGTRTMEPKGSGQFPYITDRRLFMMVQTTVFRMAHAWAFEPNGPALWQRIRTEIGGFLMRIYRQNGLQGTKPAEAFFVKADAENNPPDQVDAGVVTADIGLATQKPGEFVVLRFSKKVN